MKYKRVDYTFEHAAKLAVGVAQVQQPGPALVLFQVGCEENK